MNVLIFETVFNILQAKPQKCPRTKVNLRTKINFIIIFYFLILKTFLIIIFELCSDRDDFRPDEHRTILPPKSRSEKWLERRRHEAREGKFTRTW